MRTRSFRDAVVLVTGGSRGLGLILARLFAEEGARIVLCSRNEYELHRAKTDIENRGGEALAVVCDVSKRDEVRRMVQSAVEHFGKIDVVVNNASIIQVGPLESFGERDFKDAMDVNFWGTFHTTMEALPYLRPGSGIVNITSIGGVLSVPHLLPYSCAKFATVGFSNGLRAELAKDRIRVTTVIPGLMRTGSFVNALFKGERGREFQWFAMGSALPGPSMDAERAARKIVRACRRGDPIVTLGLPAKAARIFSAVFPRLTLRLLTRVNAFLPGPVSVEQRHEAGVKVPLGRLGERARRKFQEGAS